MSRERRLVSMMDARQQRARERGDGASRDDDTVSLLTRIVTAQGEIAAAGPDPQDVVDAITRRAQELTGSDGAVLELRDADTIRYWSASGIAHTQIGFTMPIQGSLTGRCIEENIVLRCDDSETDPRVNRDACRRVGLRSMLVAPLRFRGDVVGVLKVISALPEAYDDTDRYTLEHLSTLVAASLFKAIETAQLRSALDARMGRGERARKDANHARDRLLQVLQQPLAMALQPIVRLSDGAVVGCEALARFPIEYDLSTSRWFEDAAQCGLSVELELAAAAGALHRLGDVPRDAYLAINVSPETACSDALKALLAAHDLQRLVLEITEHTAVEDYSQLADRLAEFQQAGLRIAVDDTGAGFASLRHVLRLAPDIIKLDIALTRDVDTRPRLQSLISALLTFAQGTRAELIAEGVETEAQLDALKALGVQFGQGYYLGRPAIA